jgi:hypothetical protein
MNGRHATMAARIRVLGRPRACRRHLGYRHAVRRLYLAVFATGLVVYAIAAWGRIWQPSTAPHFVYQADAWLHGSVAIAASCGDPGQRPCGKTETPLPADDWATVETVELADGTVVQGRRLVQARGSFRQLDGTIIPVASIQRSVGYTAYVSFPPIPSLLMLPGAALSGREGNDVIPTLLVAALILPLTLLLLRRLAEAKLSERSVRDDLWLVGMLAFGSVLFFSAVQGKVWYTAHVVGVALALVYAWASIEARRPIIAGLALGAAALTRTAMAFMVLLFVFETWRMAGDGDWRAKLRAMRAPLLRFAVPVVALAIAGAVYNYIRFESPTEFGHSYLALGNRQPVRQQLQIEQWGLASYHYLARNLAVAFTLLPELGNAKAPWIQISGHGLAMWVTTPALVLLLWPRTKGPLHRVLWLTTLVVALPSLCYMNSGWFQFGYRFSLDYMVFLVMLLAVGGRPLGYVAKALIIAGVVVNLFGAYTFDRKNEYYRYGGNAYDVIVPN